MNLAFLLFLYPCVLCAADWALANSLSKTKQPNNDTAAKIKHFDPSAFDFGKKKAFPMRPGHFFASCEKAMTDLDWAPEYNTVDGLRDSYENDFVHKKVGGAGGASFVCCVVLT